MQTNGGQSTIIKDRIKKAMRVAGKIWGIRKKNFGKETVTFWHVGLDDTRIRSRNMGMERKE